ncbi:MAG: trypsin-like peptidase domain-containing protein [Prevotella sp.]|nr:trypsin-like peptidase domain-containing protein [Prevotella sp.]
MRHLKMTAILTMAMVTLFASCGKKSADEIFEEQKSGVVLVLNKFYYKVEMPGGNQLFFNGMDQNGNILGFTTNEQEAMAKAQMLNGTGFFVGDDGKFVTNRHVAVTDLDSRQLKAQLASIVRASLMQYAMAARQIQAKYNMLEAQKAQFMEYDFFGNIVDGDETQLSQIIEEQRKLKQMYDEMASAVRQLQNASLNNIKVSTVSNIGISFDGEKVNSPSDFLVKNPCNIVKVSDKENADLALLQLKSKKTPKGAFVFKFAGEGNKEYFNGKAAEEKIKIDQQLYMIGYNAGLMLANTQKGISVQMTSGRVTQTPDGERLTYSIPTVQGSSGSPVIDDRGNVVAVNFAKLVGSDNFNFGIPLERIKEFLK